MNLGVGSLTDADKITRRRVSALLAGMTIGLSGCGADSPSAETETTEGDNTQTATDGKGTRTLTDGSDETTPTRTNTDKPTDTANDLNHTNYAAAWPFAPDGVVGRTAARPLGDSDTAAALLASSTDAEQFHAAVESATDVSLSGYRFTAATEFSTASVVVVQRRVTSGASRLRLQSVEAVGTTEPRLAVHEVDPGPTQAAPTRLLLVRLPDEGTPPSTATVRVTGPGGETTTVVAEPFG